MARRDSQQHPKAASTRLQTHVSVAALLRHTGTTGLIVPVGEISAPGVQPRLSLPSPAAPGTGFAHSLHLSVSTVFIIRSSEGFFLRLVEGRLEL